MKNILLLFFVLLFLGSCTSKTSHRTQFFLVNNSGKNIRLDYFRNGLPVNEKNISINNNKDILVYSEAEEGKGTLSSYSNYILTDSVQVIFSDGKKTTHYYFNINGSNSNAIILTNNRNIYNIEVSWIKKILLDNKKRTETDYTYTFTNEDYLRAK